MLKKIFILLVFICAAVLCGFRLAWAADEQWQLPQAKIIEGTTLYNRQQFLRQYNKAWQDAGIDEQKNFLKSAKAPPSGKNVKRRQRHKSIFSSIKSTGTVSPHRKRRASIVKPRRNFSKRIVLSRLTMGRSGKLSQLSSKDSDRFSQRIELTSSFSGLRSKVQQRFGRRTVAHGQSLKRKNFVKRARH